MPRSRSARISAGSRPVCFAVRGDEGGDAVGVEGAGQQIVDRDIGVDHLPRDAGDEAGEAGAGTAGEVEPGHRHLHRAGGDVDDAPETPLDHPIDDRLDELDRRDHVRLQPGEHALVIDLAEVARRRAAIVVDEDVDLIEGTSRAARPSGVDMSPATAITSAPVSAAISSRTCASGQRRGR